MLTKVIFRFSSSSTSSRVSALLQQLVQEDAEGGALAWWYRPADPVVGKDGGGWEPGDDGVALAVAGLFVG